MRTLFTVLGIVVAVLLVLLFLLTRTPKWYQPLKPAEPRKVSPYLTHKLAPEIYNNVQFGKPFTIEVTEDGFNDIISRGNWPLRLNGYLLESPAVIFANDRIWLMGTVRGGPVPVVATVIIRPCLDSEAKLAINIDRAKLGMLNATPLIKNAFAKVTDSYIQQDDDNSWLGVLSAALLDNETIDPVFTVKKEKVRLTEFEIQDGSIVITLNPQ